METYSNTKRLKNITTSSQTKTVWKKCVLSGRTFGKTNISNNNIGFKQKECWCVITKQRYARAVPYWPYWKCFHLKSRKKSPKREHIFELKAMLLNWVNRTKQSISNDRRWKFNKQKLVLIMSDNNFLQFFLQLIFL